MADPVTIERLQKIFRLSRDQQVLIATFADLVENNSDAIEALDGEVPKIGEDGALDIPTLATDPASPRNNTMWINTTGNVLKVRINGTIRTVTVS